MELFHKDSLLSWQTDDNARKRYLGPLGGIRGGGGRGKGWWCTDIDGFLLDVKSGTFYVEFYSYLGKVMTLGEIVEKS